MERDFPEAQEPAHDKLHDSSNKTPGRQLERLTHLVQLYYCADGAMLILGDQDQYRIEAAVANGVGVPDQAASALWNLLLLQEMPCVVPDATQDVRFYGVPLGVGRAKIRFLACTAVRAPSGRQIGLLCLYDTDPRKVANLDLDVLQTVTTAVEDRLGTYQVPEKHPTLIESGALARSISNAQAIFLRTDDDHAAFEALLEDLLNLTNCAFGFIGEVLDSEQGQPYVKVRAITNLSWDEATARLYDEVNRRGMVFDRLDNLIGAAVIRRSVVISDNVKADPRKGGTPSGHPPISTYIGIPVFAGDSLVGLIGLANRPAGFSMQFAQSLAPLTSTVGTLIERKRLYAERARQHEVAEHAANFDQLTGLPNRRLFTKLFEEKLSDAQAYGKSLSVCFIDLDGFKWTNDTYGHNTGDAILREVAERLSATMRPTDLVARFSGDEFVTVLENVPDPSFYERLLQSVNEPIKHGIDAIQMSSSMDVTVYPKDSSDRDVLLRHADQALYDAKIMGRNKIALFDVTRHRSRKAKHKVAEDFRRALAENELELYYQPKVDLQRQKVVGFEALIRWHHPKDGFLLPDVFLPALAHTAQEIRLGEFVISEGVKTLTQFSNMGTNYSVCINISAQHILSDGFLPYLEESIARLASESRSKLCIEVLESMALKDLNRAIEVLNASRRLGITLSLDDFGTGFSSLNYFRRFPVSEVKIDSSFVKEMLNDPSDKTIVLNIINLARGFNRQVVGEGVESVEIAEELAKSGCDFAQGHYFSAPLCLKEALSWSEKFERQ